MARDYEPITGKPRGLDFPWIDNIALSAKNSSSFQDAINKLRHREVDVPSIDRIIDGEYKFNRTPQFPIGPQSTDSLQDQLPQGWHPPLAIPKELEPRNESEWEQRYKSNKEFTEKEKEILRSGLAENEIQRRLNESRKEHYGPNYLDGIYAPNKSITDIADEGADLITADVEPELKHKLQKYARDKIIKKVEDKRKIDIDEAINPGKSYVKNKEWSSSLNGVDILDNPDSSVLSETPNMMQEIETGFKYAPYDKPYPNIENDYNDGYQDIGYKTDTDKELYDILKNSDSAINLKPLMALTDAWTGSNLAGSYELPSQKRDKLVSYLMNKRKDELGMKQFNAENKAKYQDRRLKDKIDRWKTGELEHREGQKLKSTYLNRLANTDLRSEIANQNNETRRLISAMENTYKENKEVERKVEKEKEVIDKRDKQYETNKNEINKQWGMYGGSLKKKHTFKEKERNLLDKAGKAYNSKNYWKYPSTYRPDVKEFHDDINNGKETRYREPAYWMNKDQYISYRKWEFRQQGAKEPTWQEEKEVDKRLEEMWLKKVRQWHDLELKIRRKGN